MSFRRLDGFISPTFFFVLRVSFAPPSFLTPNSRLLLYRNSMSPGAVCIRRQEPFHASVRPSLFALQLNFCYWAHPSIPPESRSRLFSSPRQRSTAPMAQTSRLVSRCVPLASAPWLVLCRVQVKKEGGKWEGFHAVLSLLSYMLKAPLVPPGTPVVNALFAQRQVTQSESFAFRRNPSFCVDFGGGERGGGLAAASVQKACPVFLCMVVRCGLFGAVFDACDRLGLLSPTHAERAAALQ